VRQDHPINWYENRDAYIAGLMNFIAISAVETCGAIPDRYITELSYNPRTSTEPDCIGSRLLSSKSLPL
jgi:hypothetical protein